MNAKCENTGGNYTCHCRTGFSGNGVSCSDIDECASDSNNCDQMANCTNTIGSYVCTCRDGYTGDGISCLGGQLQTFVFLMILYAEYLIDFETDTDECELREDNCGTHATCKNTEGGFTCTCNSGFDGNGTNCFGKYAR